ncbi:MAG: DNA primase [Betaproteobacteria bacterium]|nr:DNA primase [Betaproteobacteria bacterium]
MIPQGFIDELLSRTDIGAVIGRHVELKKSGANLMGLCPFHAERSPSFSVTPSKGFYHCFGCGAGGDAIRFLVEHLGLSFVEAVRDLAQAANMVVPEEHASPEERERQTTLRQRRQTLGELLAKAAAFYKAQLKASPRAIEYLKGRGLSGAIAARFGLGFAPPGSRTLAGVFGQYDDPRLEEAGLVRVREADEAGHGETPGGDAGGGGGGGGERSRYDWFRNRIMFPIRGVGGEVIGFGGRVLDESKPKYMNSPETPVFSKGRELYGLYEARQALREAGYALVVEGYMDVVALAQHGFANAVATLGTACTAEHVQKLFRFTDAVVFAFDGDAAGQRAAARALEASLPHATDLRSVKFLFLPPEHDPDSFVRELGPEAFRAAVAAAVPLSRQLQEQAGEGCDLETAEGRARLLAQARLLWQALPEGVLKQQLLAELAAASRLETADLARLWGVGGRGAARGSATGDPTGRSGRSGPLRLLRPGSIRVAPAGPADVALRLLLQHSDWWDKLSHDDLELLHQLAPPYGDVVRWLETQIVEHGPLPWSQLHDAMAAESWADAARAWVRAGLGDEAHSFDELRRILFVLLEAVLRQEADSIVAGSPGPEDLVRVREILQQVAAIKAGRV